MIVREGLPRPEQLICFDCKIAARVAHSFVSSCPNPICNGISCICLAQALLTAKTENADAASKQTCRAQYRPQLRSVQRFDGGCPQKRPQSAFSEVHRGVWRLVSLRIYLAPQVGSKVMFSVVRDHPIENITSFVFNNLTSVQVRRLPTKAVKICWPLCWPFIIVIG
jgi:hypothetical protein